jgi:hypothetical protein
MPAFFPYGFAIFFAGMWAGVSFLLSRVSGWPSLAARYRVNAEPSGERLLWSSASVGGVSFRSCLNMCLSPAGLYMVPSLPFRMFMPALLIPWSDVSFEGFTKVLFFDFACLRLGGTEGPLLCVRRKTGERFRPFLASQGRLDFEAGSRFAGSIWPKNMGAVAALLAAVGAAGAIVAVLANRR